MKQLSIEEKAKAYDKAKSIMEKYLKSGNAGVIAENTIKKAFPELKESEDERIRKELLEHCKNQAKPYIQTGNKCPQIQSWIDWLEKQKTSEEAMKYLKENHSSSEVSDFQAAMNIAVAKAYDKGKADAITEMQNTAWSEEDENINQSIIDILAKQGFQTQVNWLKSLRDRVQPKQEWSEEDKGNLLELKCIINELWSNQKVREEIDRSSEDLESLWDWLDNIWKRIIKYPRIMI